MATPLGAILDWTMGTPAGFAAYRDPRVNAMIRKILNAWSRVPQQRRLALRAQRLAVRLEDAPRPGARSASSSSSTTRKDEHWGFTSWNDFFTRRFKDGERPVAAPDDDKVIVSACESTPYGISTDVQLHDRFWIKCQPYSLQDMLASDDSADAVRRRDRLSRLS